MILWMGCFAKVAARPDIEPERMVMNVSRSQPWYSEAVMRSCRIAGCDTTLSLPAALVPRTERGRNKWERPPSLPLTLWFVVREAESRRSGGGRGVSPGEPSSSARGGGICPPVVLLTPPSSTSSSSLLLLSCPAAGQREITKPKGKNQLDRTHESFTKGFLVVKGRGFLNFFNRIQDGGAVGETFVLLSLEPQSAPRNPSTRLPRRSGHGAWSYARRRRCRSATRGRENGT